jgi:ABC-type sugar transport system substrate-binding protein
MVQHVDNGTVKTVLLWNPVDLGYLTVQAGKAIATGQKLGDKLKAGRLGEKEVKGTQILLGEPMRFTKDNIHQFQF